MNLSYISAAVAVFLLAVLYLLKRKNVSFGSRVLIGMFLGVIIGLIFKNNIEFANTIYWTSICKLD